MGAAAAGGAKKNGPAAEPPRPLTAFSLWTRSRTRVPDSAAPGSDAGAVTGRVGERPDMRWHR